MSKITQLRLRKLLDQHAIQHCSFSLRDCQKCPYRKTCSLILLKIRIYGIN